MFNTNRWVKNLTKFKNGHAFQNLERNQFLYDVFTPIYWGMVLITIALSVFLFEPKIYDAVISNIFPDTKVMPLLNGILIIIPLAMILLTISDGLGRRFFQEVSYISKFAYQTFGLATGGYWGIVIAHSWYPVTDNDTILSIWFYLFGGMFIAVFSCGFCLIHYTFNNEKGGERLSNTWKSLDVDFKITTACAPLVIVLCILYFENTKLIHSFF